MKKILSLLMLLVLSSALMCSSALASEGEFGDVHDKNCYYEHNYDDMRVVDYYINIDPTWSEDEVYAEVERIINSEYISIVPYNFLCSIFGHDQSLDSEIVQVHISSANGTPHAACYYFMRIWYYCARCGIILFEGTPGDINSGHYLPTWAR